MKREGFPGQYPSRGLNWKKLERVTDWDYRRHHLVLYKLLLNFGIEYALEQCELLERLK